MLDPRQALADFQNGLQATMKVTPDELNSFNNFVGVTLKDRNISLKTKELISVAISVFSRCEYCIVGHVYNALKIGLTREEILEACMVAIAFGGGPAMAYTATLVEKSIDEFENDFK